jgi:hypothetical protein
MDLYELTERRWRPGKEKWLDAMIQAPFGGPEVRVYHPLEEETGLFRTFADLEPVPDAFLSFTRAYGRLGVNVCHVKPTAGQPGFFAERVEAWRMRVIWLKFLVGLWDLARAGDRPGLAEYIRWNGSEATVHIPPERPACVMHLADTYIGSPDTLIDVAKPDTPLYDDRTGPLLTPGDSVSLAMAFCAAALNAELGRTVAPRLAWSVEQRPVLVVRPKTLWGAMVLQFTTAIDGQRQFQRCPACGRWFVLEPGINRANKLACSGSCRTVLYRRRQERARQMHAAGKTARHIAKELGSTVDKVKKWISDVKGT